MNILRIHHTDLYGDIVYSIQTQTYKDQLLSIIGLMDVITTHEGTSLRRSQSHFPVTRSYLYYAEYLPEKTFFRSVFICTFCTWEYVFSRLKFTGELTVSFAECSHVAFNVIIIMPIVGLQTYYLWSVEGQKT